MAIALSWIIAFILVLLPFHAFLTTWAGASFGHYDLWKLWKELLLVVITPPAVWLALRDPELRQWLAKSWIVRLFCLYVLLHLVLGLWALRKGAVNVEALGFAWIINLRFIYFFIICGIVARYSGFLLRHWAKILLLPAAVVVIFGVLQKIVLPVDFLRHFGYSSRTIPAYQTVDANIDYQRVLSTLRGANPLGAYLTLIVPATLMQLRKSRILQVGLILASAEVLYFTYSRSAWLGAALAAGLAFGWLSAKKINFRPAVAISAAAVVIVLAAGTLYYTRHNSAAQDVLLHTSSNSSSSVTSNEAHISALKSGTSDIYHQPLGRGPGTAGPASARNDHPARIAENYFLQIGQEVGIIGMALFVVINALAAFELWCRRTQPLAAILLAALLGITLINLLSHAWTDDTLAYIWWGLAGLACAPHYPAARRSPARR